MGGYRILTHGHVFCWGAAMAYPSSPAWLVAWDLPAAHVLARQAFCITCACLIPKDCQATRQKGLLQSDSLVKSWAGQSAEGQGLPQRSEHKGAVAAFGRAICGTRRNNRPTKKTQQGPQNSSRSCEQALQHTLRTAMQAMYQEHFCAKLLCCTRLRRKINSL